MIGKYTYGAEGILIRQYDSTAELIIGSFCSIASGVKVFLGGNHRLDWACMYPFGRTNTDIFPWHGTGTPASKGDVVIGNDVWIGENATILSGVKIGDGAAIGCHAVVTKDVAPYTVVAGNPARVIRKRFTDAQIVALRARPWWELSDYQIERLILLLCSDKVDELIAAIKGG